MRTSKRAITTHGLVGKTIIGFDPQPFPDGRGRKAHNPIIFLSDGTQLSFHVKETDSGYYGVDVYRHFTSRKLRSR